MSTNNNEHPLGMSDSLETRLSGDDAEADAGVAADPGSDTMVDELAQETMEMIREAVEFLTLPLSGPFSSSAESTNQATSRMLIMLMESARSRIEQVHAAAMYDSTEDGRNSGKLSNTNTILKVFLERRKQGAAVESEALNAFRTAVLDWIGSTPLRLPDHDSFTTPNIPTITIAASAPFDRPLEHLTSQSLSPPPDSTAYRDDDAPCPIETAALPFGFITNSSSDSTTFFNWALTLEIPFAHSHARLGAARSVELWRGRKAPFFHEFTLVSFVNESGAESWMRVERAARAKDIPYKPQWDSSGPVFRGVEVRETVSFETSQKALLFKKADRLACLTLDHTTTTDAGSLFLLYDLALQYFMTTRFPYPAYQLFTANCRWFARRMFYNFVQFGILLDLQHKITWKGTECSVARIADKLQAEKFGGKQLEDERGALLRIEGIEGLAFDRLRRGEFAAAVSLARKTLAMAEETLQDIPIRPALVAYALSALGAVLRYVGQISEAAEHFERSCEIGRTLPDGASGRLSQTLEAYASTQEELGNGEKSSSLLRECVELTRKLYNEYPDQYRPALRDRLLALGKSLYAHGAQVESNAFINEALDFGRIIYAGDVDRWRFASSLERDAVLLHKIGREDESREHLKQAVQVMKETPDAHKDVATYHTDLSRRLLALGVSCIRSGSFIEALDSAKEALDIQRAVHVVGHSQADDWHITALDLYATVLSNLERHEEASAIRFELALLEAEKLPENQSF